MRLVRIYMKRFFIFISTEQKYVLEQINIIWIIYVRYAHEYTDVCVRVLEQFVIVLLNFRYHKILNTFSRNSICV